MVIYTDIYSRISLKSVSGDEMDFMALPNDRISISDDVEFVRIFVFKKINPLTNPFIK